MSSSGSLLLEPLGCASSAGLVGERRVLGGQLAGGVVVAAPRPAARYAATIGVSSANRRPRLSGRGLVGVDRRVGEARLELGVLGYQRLDGLEHGSLLGVLVMAYADE